MIIEQRLRILEKKIGIKEELDDPNIKYKSWCNRNLRVPFESNLERFETFLLEVEPSEEDAYVIMRKQFRPGDFNFVSKLIRKCCG